MGVLIAGMHRSGTSMVGQWADDLGLSSGAGAHLEATSANPRGLYERADVVAFNDRWLGVLGGSWWAPPFVKEQTWRSIDEAALEVDRRALDLFRPGQPAWYAKDPRLSLLLPLWDRLTLQRLPVVVGVRPPRDVAMSLHVRNGFTLRRGLALWIAYNRNLFRQASGRRVLVLDLGSAMAEPRTAVAALADFLGEVTGDPAAIAADVRPDLIRQQQPALPGYAERLAVDLDEVYAELRSQHATPQEGAEQRLSLPDWAAEALDELSEFWDLQVRRDMAESQVRDARTEVADLSAALAAVPTGWRKLIPRRSG